MSTTTITYEGTLTVTSCWCGISLAIPASLYRKAQANNKQAIFCPLGHEFVYTKNEAEKLKDQLAERDRQLEFANRRAANNADRAAAIQRQLSAAKGQQTKLKKRIAAGVCPVPDCKRHFQNLAAHIKTKHPDFPGAGDE